MDPGRPMPPGPPPAAPGPAGPGLRGFLRTRNGKLAAVGAGGVLVLAMVKRNQAAAAASTTGTSTSSGGLLSGLLGGATGTSSAVVPTSSYDSTALDQYNQLGSAISNLNDQVDALTTANAATAAASTASTVTTGGTTPASPGGIFNPYGVGTTVAPGEQVTQAVSAGQFGYVDQTSLGGLYTVPGVSISGSEYNPAAKSATYTTTVNGNQVYESGPAGTKVFTLSGTPTNP